MSDIYNFLFVSDSEDTYLNLSAGSIKTSDLLGVLLTGRKLPCTTAEILSKCGGIGNLSRLKAQEIAHLTGISMKTAQMIEAAFSLSARASIDLKRDIQIMAKSSDIADVFMKKVGGLTYEEFWIMLLNNGNRIINVERISQGGIHQTVADPKVIFEKCLLSHATGLILCHNHPSGSLTPSKHDIELTHQIIEGAHALSIRVLDHVIVTSNNYLSFAEEGMLF